MTGDSGTLARAHLPWPFNLPETTLRRAARIFQEHAKASWDDAALIAIAKREKLPVRRVFDLEAIGALLWDAMTPDDPQMVTQSGVSGESLADLKMYGRSLAAGRLVL